MVEVVRRSGRFPPAHDRTAHAAVVVAAIVASIPTIITEAAALRPAAVASTAQLAATVQPVAQRVSRCTVTAACSGRRPVRAAAAWPAASLQLAATSSSSSSRTMSTGAKERARTQALSRTCYDGLCECAAGLGVRAHLTRFLLSSAGNAGALKKGEYRVRAFGGLFTFPVMGRVRVWTWAVWSRCA